MSKEVQPLYAEFQKIAEEASTLSFLPRDSELQGKAVEELVAFESKLQGFIDSMAAKGEDDNANVALSLQFLCEAMRNELQMWLHLKEGKWDDAWNCLVGAQEAVRDASLAHGLASFLNASSYSQKVEAIEMVVFPPQIFTSPGMVVKSLVCSICENDSTACKHVEGRAYAGKLCRYLPRGIEFQHMALVDAPHDKRRRITHFGDQGAMRSRMTWAIEQETEKKN